MSTFLPAEKGMTIRMPSTANLMLDSNDRNVAPTPWDFQITRTQSILNGFFTRIATAEVVLEWNIPNVAPGLSNNTFSVTVGSTPYSVTLPTGSYTVADALNALVVLLNAAGTGVTWSVTQVGIATFLTATGAYSVNASNLALQLGFPIAAAPATSNQVLQPDLRTFRYLDFVSPQLTYNQDLKDSTTGEIARDVLCRWYMAWDQPTTYDQYGFPILMGYTPFVARRIFSPPKQIRWDNIQPVGNLTFQVYAGSIFPQYNNKLMSVIFPLDTDQYNTNWLMTLLVSEV